MSETTQYSVIILWNDSEANLPGAPTSLDPLTFGPALETGELVFTKDTGRMFVGHDPIMGQPNYERTSFPYQNVEVLTENSTAKVGQMFGAYLRDENSNSFYYASLPSSASMAPITVTVGDAAPQEYTFPDVGSLAIEMEYVAFNSNGKPIKMGKVRVMHGEGIADPIVVDDGTNLGAPLLSFDAVVRGAVGSEEVLMQYSYTGAGNVILRWKTCRTLIGGSL